MKAPLPELELLLAKANSANIQTVLVTLELARTMMWAASGANAERMHVNARRHYDRALALFPRLKLDANQLSDLTAQLGALRAELVAVGETF